MNYVGSKTNGTAKEEGELSDDDDDNSYENSMRNSRTAYFNRDKGVSRYFSSEQSKNYEMGNKSGSKRKDTRRRTEGDNRRSSRTTSDGGIKKHREHQDSRQTSIPESHTSSKIWANRRFRASSVRPLSPRHLKPSGPKRTDSPQLYKYRAQDSNAEGQDELDQLEREQRRIREQLKSLEEEEQNDDSNENDCVLESLDARSETGEDLVNTGDSSALNYILEAEKSEDDDIDVQELRRLALATSERHIRLMATEPLISQPGIPDSDIVIIPDVEPDMPEPEVVMVDEEEECVKTKNLRHTEPSAESSQNLLLSSHSKKKSRKSGKLKKKLLYSINDQFAVQNKERVDVKSKVTKASPKKSRSKKRKKVKVEKWVQQLEQLRIMVVDNPEEALEKLQKLLFDGKEKPIATGTIKDFKRQKHIPVLSDKRAVQSFTQKSADKKKAILEKSKEVKEQEKKSGQLQDNYEEVEMDIDSNAENEEESSNCDGLQFGEDFNQAMLPVTSYENVDYSDIQQNTQHTLLPPLPSQPFHAIHFEAAVPPPFPPPIPPPPPQHPPAYEQELAWKNNQALLEKRMMEIMDSRIVVNSDEASRLMNQVERIPVFHGHQGTHPDSIDASASVGYLSGQATSTVTEHDSRDFEDYNKPSHKLESSLDDAIGRLLRLIRHKQENISSEAKDVHANRNVEVLSGVPSQKYASDGPPHNLIPLTENSSSSEDIRCIDKRIEHYPKGVIQTSQSFLGDIEGFQYGETYSPSLPDERKHGMWSDDLPEIEKYVDNSQAHRKLLPVKDISYRSSQKSSPMVRKIHTLTSPGPPRRIYPGERHRDYSRDVSGSPHFSVHSRRPHLSSKSKHRDESYISHKKSAPGGHLGEHLSERSPAGSDYVPHKRPLHRSPSPKKQIHRRRNSSSGEMDSYEPEVPYAKKLRHSTPPPYIPTSIRPASTFQDSEMHQLDHHHSSDSEEEDPIALRNKLLADVIEKRKTIVEGPSNNTTPSGMSPMEEIRHLESPGTLTVECSDRCQMSSTDLTSSQEEVEEEDIKPPPVISRRGRQLNKPSSLTDLCKERLIVAKGDHHQRGQYEQQNQEHCSQQSELKDSDTHFSMNNLLEENNEDLSESDLDTLRAYISRAKAHAPERRKQSISLKDGQYIEARDKFAQEETPDTAIAAVSVLHPYLQDQSNSDIVSPSSLNNYSHLNFSENPRPSVRNYLHSISLTSSVTSTAGSRIITDHDGLQYINSAQDAGFIESNTTDLITSLAVISTNTSGFSDIPCIGTTSTSPLVITQCSLLPSKPLALHHQSSVLEQSMKDINGASVMARPKAVSFKIKPKTSLKHYPDQSLSQRLQPTSSDVLKPSVTSKAPSSLGTSTNIDIISASSQSNQNFQQGTHNGPGDRSDLFSRNASEVQAHSTADTTRPLTSVPVRISENRPAISKSATVKTAESVSPQISQARRVMISDPSTTLSPSSDRPGLSSYSSQYYSSVNSSGPRKYSNAHALPVHPQVIVPMNSSSGSDGEGDDDNEKQMSESAASAQALLGGEEQDIDIFLNAQGALAEVRDTASQFLAKQEELLSAQELAIQKDQKTVKLLVKRAVKFLEAQQQEEEKRGVLRAQLLALSHKLKTTEKLVMLFKAEKEQTEKKVQLVTERLLQKKKLYASKAKSVMSLGNKLLGPAYVPRITKPHYARTTSQDSTSQDKNLTKAQRIAQEKLKLKEKEKQIAEKLRKLKEMKAVKDTGKPPAVKIASDMLKNAGPKWKVQDVIRIDINAKPDVSVKKRRKSLLEINTSRTPNIPLTPRRSRSGSNMEKENISEAMVDVKPVAREVDANMSTAFKMPGGTQLANFCKLQREKTQRYLKNPLPSSAACEYSFPSLTALQASAPATKIRLQGNEKLRQSHDDVVSFQKTLHAYTSPLLMFRSYRFNSYFRTKENLSLQSSTYSHKINPNSILCPYDLQGTCNDDSCQQLHPKDYKLSDHELLEDIVSYSPKLAGAADGASAEEVEKCIVTFVDNLLSKHRGKMTIDDLCLWLLSQVSEASGKRKTHTISLEPRVWKPQPKEETGLCLDLNQKMTTRGIEAINVDKKVADKDSVVNEEDVRYFAGDVTELLSLEASIMEDQTNIQLWLKLASKKCHDPNKSPKECLDQALSVLARGLEANRNEPELWHMYLTLYKKHTDVKDFPEFCQTALEYAPSYDLWFLYLDSLKTYSEKDEVSTQTLHFLCECARNERASVASEMTKTKRTKKASITFESNSGVNEDIKAVSGVNNTLEISEHIDGNTYVENETMEAVMLSDSSKATGVRSEREMTVKKQKNSERRQCDLAEVKDSKAEMGTSETKSSNFDWKKLSHQTLEMVLYKTCLNLHTGRIKTALHFLQTVLGLKKAASFTLNLAELLLSADLLVLWLTYIHVLEWHQLPQHLYSISNQNPGRIMAKENITLPWSPKSPLHTGVDSLVKLHDAAARVWEHSEKDGETTACYVKLIQSHVSLLVSQNRHTEAIEKCRRILLDKKLVDIWLTLADLYASVNDNQAVKQVFSEALSTHRYSSKLMFHQCIFLYQQEKAEKALRNLKKFAHSYFDINSKSLHHHDPIQLYSQLLKQQEAFSLHTARVKGDVSDSLHKDIYIWLCYCLLLELQNKTSDTVEIYERSLTHAQTPSDLILVWQNYIAYLMRSRIPPKEVREIIVRSIISVPTKFPVLYSPLSSTMWVNYYHSNRLVEAWLMVLSPEDVLDFMEMCLNFMPNNIQLLLRAIDLCLDLKETRRAYSWCKFVAAQAEKPANLSFWKMAIALAQMEGSPREFEKKCADFEVMRCKVENMLIGCVETMPLAVSGWKEPKVDTLAFSREQINQILPEFLLFEVTRENLVAVQKLLTYCQTLELNIQGFVATISAP